MCRALNSVRPSLMEQVKQFRPPRGQPNASMVCQRRLDESYALHSWRSIGHCCLLDSVSIHLSRQCMWKTCVHWPQTIAKRKGAQIVNQQSLAMRRGSTLCEARRHTQWAIIPGHLAIWARSIVGRMADTADVVLFLVLLVAVIRGAAMIVRFRLGRVGRLTQVPAPDGDSLIRLNPASSGEDPKSASDTSDGWADYALRTSPSFIW